MKHKSRRQFLDWHIRRMTLRLAELEKRLAALEGRRSRWLGSHHFGQGESP